MLDAIREVQIPLLAAMLLGGCATKLARTMRTGSFDNGLGPTALFPMQLRRPLALTMCTIEGGLGLGLILTAGRIGAGPAATCVRLGAFLLFLVATSALIELRQTRPEVGCGCFGDFSTAPVSGRTLARSAFLAIAALLTLGLRPLQTPGSARAALELIAFLCAELIVIGVLSPEVGEGLIRLGYSEPCELRTLPSARTLAALRRSKHWRRYSGLITSDTPGDVWRELCWRYVVYPGRLDGQAVEVVFAVFLQHRRPPVQVAIVDAVTGLQVPWPGLPPARPAPGPARHPEPGTRRTRQPAGAQPRQPARERTVTRSRRRAARLASPLATGARPRDWPRRAQPAPPVPRRTRICRSLRMSTPSARKPETPS